MNAPYRDPPLGQGKITAKVIVWNRNSHGEKIHIFEYENLKLAMDLWGGPAAKHKDNPNIRVHITNLKTGKVLVSTATLTQLARYHRDYPQQKQTKQKEK